MKPNSILFRTSGWIVLLAVAVSGACRPEGETDSIPGPPGLGKKELRPGLAGRYGDGRHRVHLVTPTPNFYLAEAESLHPSLDPHFQAEWEGFLSILEAGRYRFEGGGQLEIGGKKVGGEAVTLGPGRHRIRLGYQRLPGPARLRLRWESEHFPLEPIPSRLLFHESESAPGPDQDRVEQGRDLVEDLGCANCHANGSRLLDRRRGPDLAAAAGLDPAWLHRWLLDPAAVRPEATMPALLDEEEARDVTAFFASRATVGVPVRGAERPAVDTGRGRDLYAALGCTACHTSESYSLDSVGSKMTVAGLARYLEDPARHHPDSRMPSLHLDDAEALQIAAYLTGSGPEPPGMPVTGGNASRGEELIRSRGCLSCHRFEDREQAADSHPAAPATADLSPDGGCLAENPGPTVPRYRLDGEQRAAIRDFLRLQQRFPDVSPAPVYDFYRRVRRLRCTACHVMDHFGGGQVAGTPVLTAAGEKLRLEFLEQALLENVRLRSWLSLRMPRFSRNQVEPLIHGFAKASGLDPSASAVESVTSQQDTNRGLTLLGKDTEGKSLGCIGCHDWQDYRAQGEPAPQLAEAAHRLRYPWYRRFMLNPARILSGTSMPEHFTAIAPEEREESIQRIWGALGVGEAGHFLPGLDPPPDPWTAEARPVPVDGTIVVRSIMPEATPAAIAVGMPGGLSYCFDAGSHRLLYAWQGEFLDLEDTLRRKRGDDGFTLTPEIPGRRFFRSTRFPFRLADSGRVPETRFQGYRMQEGVPEFHYSVGGAEVYEQIRPTAAADGFRWEFRIERVQAPLRFDAGIEGPVQITPSRGTVVEGNIRIPIDGDTRFEIVVRRSGDFQSPEAISANTRFKFVVRSAT